MKSVKKRGDLVARVYHTGEAGAEWEWEVVDTTYCPDLDDEVVAEGSGRSRDDAVLAAEEAFDRIHAKWTAPKVAS